MILPEVLQNLIVLKSFLAIIGFEYYRVRVCFAFKEQVFVRISVTMADENDDDLGLGRNKMPKVAKVRLIFLAGDYKCSYILRSVYMSEFGHIIVPFKVTKYRRTKTFKSAVRVF